QQLAVHVQHLAAAAIVQVVDVLRHERERMTVRREGSREARERSVCGVRLDGAQLRAPFLVEAPHLGWVALPALGRGDVLDTMAFPQSARVAERAYSRIGADARAREHENMMSIAHLDSSEVTAAASPTRAVTVSPPCFVVNTACRGSPAGRAR